MAAKKILINLYHPRFNTSRGNKALIEAVQDLPNVTVRHMYDEYPDGKIDTAREQGILVQHDVLVNQHPLFWISSPSLLKEWQDTVLQKGFAFPPGEGTKLAGKIWQTVVTTGGPEEGYTKEGPFGADLEEMLIPFRLTAMYCSMEWKPAFLVGSVMAEDAPGQRAISEDDLQKKAAEYRALLESF